MFEDNKIVAILTAYKRDYFVEQINAVLNQSIKPDKIIIFNNGSLDLSHLKEMFGDDISLINSEINTKFWGRFAIANLCNTEYVFMLDDDTIPGSKWVETCLELCERNNCIVTGNGRGIANDQNWADGGTLDADTKVASGGHSWFFKKEWLKYFIAETPISYVTGEDISFSALCKIKGNIETWTPKQDGREITAHKNSYAGDEHASFHTAGWDNLRVEICQHFINLGWEV